MEILIKNKKVIFRHVLVWAIFIAWEITLIKINVGLTASPFHYMIYYLLNMVLFYFNAHVILDYAFFKTDKPYLIAALLIMAEIFIYLLVKLELDDILTGADNFHYRIDRATEKIWLGNVWREIYFVGFSIAYWSMLYMVRFKEQNHLIEKEKLEAIQHALELENKYIVAENAYLQNQISPHLLFNTLNFIYNQIRNLSEKAGKAVSLLAEIMHYSLVPSEDNRTVPLKEELKHIDQLIELSQLRHQEFSSIRYHQKGDLKQINILPLILITLVENMIKHGELGDPDCPATIRLEQTEKALIFETQNNKRPSSLYPKGGIGLKNVEKRLANHYPGRYDLAIVDNIADFTLKLTIYDES